MYASLLALVFAFSIVADWVDYTNTEGKYRLSYPSTWTQTSTESGIIFLTPAEGEDDQFQENVNILLQDLSAQPMTLEEFTKLSTDQYDAMKESVEVLSVDNATVAANKAKKVMLTLDYSGRPLKLMQYWFIKNDTAYVLTYTAEVGKYTKYEADANKMMTSIALIK